MNFVFDKHPIGLSQLLANKINKSRKKCFKQKIKTITRAKLVCETAPKSLFGPQAVYQDLSSRHDCPVEIAIARLANQVEGKFLACSRRSNGRARRSDGLPLFFPSYDLTRSQPYERRALLSKRPQQASPEQKSRRCIADVTSRVRLRLLFKLEANQR